MPSATKTRKSSVDRDRAAEPSDGRRNLVRAIQSLEQALARIERPSCRAAASALATVAADVAESDPGSDRIDIAESLTAALALQGRDRVEHALADRNQQFRDILSACPLGVAVISRRGWKRLFINQNLADMFKAPSIEGFQHQDLSDSWVDKAEFSRAARSIDTDVDHVDFEAQRRCFDGTKIWVLMNSLPITFEGQPARVFWHNDITERKHMEDELRRFATTDVLTGVANRRHFLDIVEREVERQRRGGDSIGLLMLDVDNFKRINDGRGHACGDQVLRQIAQRCLDNVRGVDTLGRMGGEEFAVLAPGTDKTGVLRLAERLRRALVDTEIEAAGGGRLRVSISVGATLCRKADDSIDVALARADKALYAAKRAGRDRVEFC